MKIVTRKRNRLEGYDYSQCGAYFVTICTFDHRNRFWTDLRRYELSQTGMVVEQAIRQIPTRYSNIVLENYVVMPNHVHILLTFNDGLNRRKLETVMGQMKRWATMQIGAPLWQKGFYDHIIRDDEDFAVRWEYTETNPLRWQSDEFYY